MSTKDTIILTNDNEHIYGDCSNQFESKGNIRHEITFEFSRKNINIECLNDENLVFSLNNDSEIFRYFYKLFYNVKKHDYKRKSNKRINKN